MDNRAMKTILRLDTANTITVAYTGTAANSAAITATGGAAYFQLTSTTDCHINYGNLATATTSHTLLPAFTVIQVAANAGDRFSAIQSSSAGTLFITPMV